MAAFGEGNRCPGETEEQVGRNQTGRTVVAAALGPDVNVPCLTFARSVFPEASMITTLACPEL